MIKITLLVPQAMLYTTGKFFEKLQKKTIGKVCYVDEPPINKITKNPRQEKESCQVSEH